MSMNEILSSENPPVALFDYMRDLDVASAKVFWSEFLALASENQIAKDTKSSLSNNEEFSDFLVDIYVASLKDTTKESE